MSLILLILKIQLWKIKFWNPKKYWHVMENHDFQTVKSLTYLPCIVAGKKGVNSGNEASCKRMFESGKDKNESMEHFLCGKSNDK